MNATTPIKVVNRIPLIAACISIFACWIIIGWNAEYIKNYRGWEISDCLKATVKKTALLCLLLWAFQVFALRRVLFHSSLRHRIAVGLLLAFPLPPLLDLIFSIVLCAHSTWYTAEFPASPLAIGAMAGAVCGTGVYLLGRLRLRE